MSSKGAVRGRLCSVPVSYARRFRVATAATLMMFVVLAAAAPAGADGDAVLTLTPSSQTVAVPGCAAVNAHLQDGSGNPIAGALIEFLIAGPSIPPPSRFGFIWTDATGNAPNSFCAGDSSLANETDGISAVVYDGPGAGAEAFASVAWTLARDDDLALQNVPGAITTDATSPTGATFTYAPSTVSDEGGETPSVVCRPASASTFAIGTTTVRCTTSDSDDSNTPVTATFTVTVKGAAQQLGDVRDEVQGVGPGTSLSDKVAHAQSDLGSGDRKQACATLGAFVHEVRAQTGKSVPAVQAVGLVADGQRIEVVIGCS
jgi:hypothetical protein